MNDEAPEARPFSPTIPSVARPLLSAYPAFSGHGLEIEYMLVDAGSLQVRPLAASLLQAACGEAAAEVDRGRGMGWSNELALHVFEIKNQRPQADLQGLARAFQAEVQAANGLLENFGARLMPGAMHPWMNPRQETRLWNGEGAELYRTYDRIFNCQRHGWANIQSVHLNLPFGNDLEFARLHAAIRLVLPLLPALAASSPLAEGRHSGFMDYRLAVYRTHQSQFPATQGALIPEPSASRADYETRILAPMYRDMAPSDPQGLLRHEWLNARAAIPRFERHAIEIRVLDVQECPWADGAIVALACALIQRFYEAGASWLSRAGNIPTPVLAGMLEACCRDAEMAVIDQPAYLALFGFDAHPRPARALWARALEEVSAEGRLAPEWHETLHLILERGPLARRLSEAVGPSPTPKRLHEVYGELCRCLQEGRLFQG